MKKSLTIILLVILLCLVLATVSVDTLADEKKERERFTGNVIGLPRGWRGKLNITVDRWTTPEEVKQLYNLIKDGDIKAMLKAIRKKNVGWIWLRGPRFPINIASTTDTEKGRLIRLIIERPFLPCETYITQRRQDDQQFGAMEFTLSESNEGEGYVYGRVTISINEDGTVGFRPLASIRQMLKTVRKK